MLVTLKLEFATVEEARAYMASLPQPGAVPAAAPAPAAATIAPVDRPDVGTPPATEVFGMVNVPVRPAEVIPPVAPNAAPVVLPATGANAAAAGEAAAQALGVDRNGLRWDGRIHSGNRSTNADGTWRKLRGVDAALVAAVEAELRAAPAPADAAAAVPPAPAAAVPVPPAPAAAVPVPPPAAPTMTFAEFMVAVSPALGSGKLQMPALLEVLAAHGVTGGLGALAQAPAAIAPVYAALAL